jgi:hypothetical protein
MKKIYQFEIRCGKYEGRVTKGEFTSETNVKTVYGNYFYEPTTIIKLGHPWYGLYFELLIRNEEDSTVTTVKNPNSFVII